jgi:hypothetical protein
VVDITSADKADVEFTYSVSWKETDVPYERRMDKYAKYSFLPQHLEVSVCVGRGGGGGAWGARQRLPARFSV